MGFFGMSGAGKNAQNALNGTAQQNSQWASQWGNNSQDQYHQAGDLRNEVLYNNRDVAANGMGTASDARSQGMILNGDNTGWFDEQNGRYQNLSDQLNGQPSPQQVMDGVNSGVSGLRGQQSGTLSSWKNNANGQSTDAYNRVRSNTSDYAGQMNGSAQNRADSLSASTNGTYDAMASRVGSSDGALIGRNDTAYGGAKDLLTQSSSRLTGAMDANGASQMRATAPLMASAKARMRAAGVDPNSPEGASLMSQVDQTRAHAVEDNLASNISQQNAITGQKAQMGLDQEGVDRGLAQDWTNQTNSMAAKQNDLNRSDTNQLYDTSQATLNTQLNNKNAADMGEYQDQRQTDDSAQQQNQAILNTQATDQYTQANMGAGLKQQDFSNRSGIVQGQNGVSQQRVQDSNNVTGYGMNWANGQFNAQQQGRNAQQNTWNSQNQASQGWANSAQGANNSAAQGYGNIFSNESQNSGWGVKGLMGIAGSFAGGLGAGAAKKLF